MIELGKFGKRVGLVVGNSEYDKPSGKLHNTLNDAGKMKAALERLGFKIEFATNVTIGEWPAVLTKFKRSLKGADVALFYYSGHGLQYDGVNYVQPVDAQLNDIEEPDEEELKDELIKVDDVVGAMQGRPRKAGPYRTALIFLDACRVNRLARKLPRDKEEKRALAQGGLADQPLGRLQTYIAFSTQPDSTASDGDGDNSEFTKALLDNLETPDLEIEQLMKLVRRGTYAGTIDKRQPQVPWTHSSLVEDFFFCRSGDRLQSTEGTQGDSSQVAAIRASMKRMAEIEAEVRHLDLVVAPEIAEELERGVENGDGESGSKWRNQLNATADRIEALEAEFERLAVLARRETA